MYRVLQLFCLSVFQPKRIVPNKRERHLSNGIRTMAYTEWRTRNGGIDLILPGLGPKLGFNC